MLESPEAEASYQCTQCSYQVLWAFQLDHHVQRKHNNGNEIKMFHAVVEPEPYFCIYCDFKSCYKLSQYEHYISNKHKARNAENLKNRRQFYEQFESYPCNNCGYQGHSTLYFCKHNDSCQMEPMNQVEFAGLSLVPRLYCKTIMRPTPSHSSQTTSFVEKHVPRRDKINWLNCTECSHRTKDGSNLKKHMLRHAAADQIDWFNCTKCSHRSKTRSNLKQHMLRHAAADQIDWFICTKCSYRSSRKDTLNVHMLQHATADEIDWLDCTKCSYRAKSKGHLRQHMLYNHGAAEGNEWFCCAQCSYRNRLKVNLKRHMLKHAAADEINWNCCTECSYRGKRKSDLKRHALTHA